MSIGYRAIIENGPYRAFLKSISVTDTGFNGRGEIVEEWHITSIDTESLPTIPPVYSNMEFMIDPARRYALEAWGIVPTFKGSTSSGIPVPQTYKQWREAWNVTTPEWHGDGDRTNQMINDAYDQYMLLSSEIQTLPGGDVIARHRFGGFIRGLTASGQGSGTNIAINQQIEQAVVEFQTGHRDAIIWRRDWNVPPAAGSDKTGTDIGGNPVRKYSLDGRPQDVVQTRVRVRIMKNAQYVNKDDIITTLTGIVGKRNDAAFLGYAAGWLWCDGFQMVEHDGPFYELVFDFMYDEWYEHSQEPELDPDGKPTLDATGTNYADVQWVRMTRGTYDFNKIFFKTAAALTAGTIWTEQRTLAEKGCGSN